MTMITRVVKFIRKGAAGDPAVTYRIQLLSATAYVDADKVMRGAISWNIIKEVSGTETYINSSTGTCQCKLSSASSWSTAGNSGTTFSDNGLINGVSFATAGSPTHLLIRFVLGGYVKCTLAVGISVNGVKGDFKSIVFKRTNTTPVSTPSGGTYDAPVPSGWSDSIPSGRAMLWASECTFYGAGGSSGWSTPRQMTDTDTYDVEFSDVDSNPGTPTTNPSNWFDPDTDTSKDFTQMLWRAERECVNGTWGSWTVVRIKGEKGDKGDTGDSAPAATASPDKITIPCYNGGTVKSQTVKGVTFYLKVGTNDATVTNVTSGTKPTGVSVQGVYNNAVTITVGTDATASGMANGVTFTVTGTYGGKTYSAKVTVALIGTIEGPQGNPGSPGGQGSRGPALRGPQDWNALTEDGSVSYQFYQGAEGEPYLDFVIYNGYYYVCKKSHTNKNYLPTNTTYWTLTDKVAMIAASVLFAEHGYFGDAIISGQWLISANGTIDGTLYTKGQTYNSELAYNLFNANSPMGNDISKYNNTETSTLSSSATSLNKATVYLEAGRVYKLTCVGYSSNASNPCYVRLVKTDDSSVMVTPVNFNSTSSVTRYGMAHITQSGNYYIQLYHTSTGATGTVTSCELVEKCFAPTYALNLMSGKTYQRDGVFTGFIRKGKTKITTSNINNYKRTDITTATVLDFDKCGSFIELSTGTASYFSLPLLSSAIANRYTTAQKDDIRSFIGTKLLVYNNSGTNLSITYKWTTSGGTYGYTLYNGNCVELECKMDKDDGDNGTEVIYWDVIKTAAPV